MDTPEHPDPVQPLARSQHHRIVAGVCGGLAERTDVDPIVYRVTAGVLGCFGVGFLLYGAAWVLLPQEGAGETWLDRMLRRRIDGPSALVVLVGILIAGGLFVPPIGLHPAATALAIMAGLAVLTAYRRGADLVGAVRAVPGRLFSPPASPPASSSAPPPPPAAAQEHAGGTPPPKPPPALGTTFPMTSETGPRPPDWPYPPDPPYRPYSPYVPGDTPQDYTLPLQEPVRGKRGSGRLTLWTLAAVAAVTSMLVALSLVGAIPLDARLILAAALTTVGLGGLAGARHGHGRPLIGAGLVVSLLLIASSVVVPPLDDIPFGAGVDDVTWRPTAAALQQPGEGQGNGVAGDGDASGNERSTMSYALAVGEATLDLTELPQGGTYRVAADVGVGELRVRAPRGAKVTMHIDVNAGSVVVGGEQLASGPDLDLTRTLPAQDRANATLIELHLDVSVGEVRVRRVSP